MPTVNLTIYDIAKKINISPATISRVLTGSANVSDEKRQKVLDAVEKFNYTPNAIARSLKMQSTKTLGVLIPDVTVAYFAELFYGVENKSIERGYSTILCNYGNNAFYNDVGQEARYFNLLLEKQVDAVAIIGGSIDRIDLPPQKIDALNDIFKRFHTVLINGYTDHFDCPHIMTDEPKGVALAIDLLCRLGHTNFAFLGGVPYISSTYYRMNGFKQALEKNNILLKEENIISSSFTVASGFDCMQRLILQGELPTAIICVNDSVAIGAMKCAFKFGLKIPQDISIVGFDNSFICDMVTPELTSIGYNIDSLANIVATSLCDLAEGKTIPDKQSIDVQLFSRSSCMASKK